MSATVSDRLTDFILHYREAGVPPAVCREAKRLLINQLKASVGATEREVVQVLRRWIDESGAGSDRRSTVLWLGKVATPEHAAMVNGALFEVLDFNDTYIPTFMHATSGVLAALLAVAESRCDGGARMLNALALGIEVELACARILMPSGYYRGFLPGGLVGGIGAAAACAALAGLDRTHTRNAIGIAMLSAFGTYESVGSMGLPYIVGATARSGLTAFELAAHGLDAPPTAFEGEKGLLAACSDESADKIGPVLGSLGSTWEIHQQSYKTVPTETITHAPIELVLALLARRRSRSLVRLRFRVSPIVVEIADERRTRFGRPSSELTARFDLRYCAAAAWHRGRFTLAEMTPEAYEDPEILALRALVDLIPDERYPTFEGASLEAVFSDGSTEHANVDRFLGTPGNPLSDPQLSALFASAADGLLPSERIAAILDAAWRLEQIPDVSAFTSLLTFSDKAGARPVE